MKIDDLANVPELLAIGEVSKIFNIHPDTLRNWEKSGLLVPMRVGPRKDRKYRKQDIETIVAKMGSKLTLAQLEQFLWRSADILRGKIDSSDYKKYIFGLLFYKRISDVWDEEYQNVMDEYHDKTLAEADYNHRFQVPRDCKWSVIAETSENIGQSLNDIFDKITNVNSPKLDKIFDDLDFANKDRFPNETIQRLVNHFSQYNFGSTYISSDLLGDAYEYLIKQFAADAGKKGGEFYTPREVERIIIGIVKPHQKDHIYDPTVGSGGFLLESYNYLKDKSGEQIARTLYMYGQEINISTFAIAKINMFLHGLDSTDIRRGDTLANPQFLNQMGNLQTFDIVVANPPYSIKDWEFELFKSDKYGRTEGYDQPPQKNADYAFVLHILKSLNVNGRAGIVLPHGVLFRGGSEGRIREQIIKNDLLEAVIGLPPKLFYGTGIPAAILIFNRNKPENKKGKVLIIDADRDFLEGKNQNTLRKHDIDKIIKVYDQYQDVEKYARVVDIKEIEENLYNLSAKLYVDTKEKEEIINIKQVLSRLNEIEMNDTNVENMLMKYFQITYPEKKLRNENRKNYKKTKYGIIPYSWRLASLGELFEFINGYSFYRDGYSDFGYRVIDLLNITVDGNLQITSKDKFVSEEIYNKHPKQKLQKGDLIIIMTDITPDKKLLGRTAIVDESDKYTLNQRVGCLRNVNPKVISTEYARYFINSSLIHNRFVSQSLGSAQFYINTPHIKNCFIFVPPLEEQQEIVRVMKLIEDKINFGEEKQKLLHLVKQGLLQDIFSQKVQI